MCKIKGPKAASCLPFVLAVVNFATPISKSMRTLFLYSVLLLLLCGCSKVDALIELTSAPKSADGFVQYTINSGQHSATNNQYKKVETDTLRFVVKFDSTAIYTSSSKENQYDINKLYGFSDNGADHHQYSARFGWAWHDGALHLYAYVYNEGKRESRRLGAVPIGTEIACMLAVNATQYVFSYGDVKQQLPRTSTTPKAKGYQLYPYFGGDEVAPHNINIWIKNL